MSYTIEATEPEILSLSMDPLPPEDYGWFFASGGSGVLWVRHLQDMRSFRAMAREHIESGIIHAELGDPRILFDVPPMIQGQVRQRDGKPVPVHWRISRRDDWHCMLDESSVFLSISEFLQNQRGRIASFMSDKMFSATNISRAETAVTSSCTVMHKDLIPNFLNNAFSVDANDNYRIIICRDMGAVRRLLPTHISPPRGFETLKFLETHFHTSVRANILYGDVKEEYGHRATEVLMDELGVGGDDDDEMVPLSNPRWKSVIDKAILEEITRGRLTAASYDQLL
ncbi:hypothetical protein ARMGADRAFT_1166565 [Armillaria gallica]|uniref:Uncharacterized protein n=1 Tax=Armillaria gallica TaxID=47427 RepID=A0A2H3D9U6_ARMGA|nr:hypothetical protein ARMGADRAFT_1166565 [Armillaria gallica]